MREVDFLWNYWSRVAWMLRLDKSRAREGLRIEKEVPWVQFSLEGKPAQLWASSENIVRQTNATAASHRSSFKGSQRRRINVSWIDVS